jgi:glycogen debranching enzyme
VRQAALDALASLRTEEGWLAASSGAGRFASLFGRDALISALQVLPVDPSVAHATLERLGRELGRASDDETEEEPGKVLHEARDAALEAYVAHGWPVRGGRLRYWGSVDASPWFLVVVAALARAGEDVAGHLDAARRVAGWLAAQPMPLAYRRRNRRAGLAHQGWRDVAWDLEGSGHGVVGEDGRPLPTPLALAQVGALAWRALDEAATVVDRSYAPVAEAARGAWVSTFAAGGCPAFAWDGTRLDRSPTSDLGQVLWTGILEAGDRRARAAAGRLLAPDLATPFGLRTLAAGHPGFRPDGYHTGAVWPFDSWLGAAGLDAVEPGSGAGVRSGVVAAVGELSRRRGEPVFPELYAVGLDGSLHEHPESCDVQAWTVGAVLAIDAGWDGRAWAPTTSRSGGG